MYCVFWFPTIFHKSNKSYSLNPPPISIALNDIENDLLIKIDEIPVNDFRRAPSFLYTEKPYDLVFNVTDQNGNSFETHFKWVTYNTLGFVVYEYDRNDLINKYWSRFEENEQKEIIKNAAMWIIPRIKKEFNIVREIEPNDELIKNYIIDRILISLYQHVVQLSNYDKEFENKYKLYYYEGERADGGLEYLREVPSISEENNPVIIWYIKQFEKHFVSQADFLSTLYYRWSEDLNNCLSLNKRVIKALGTNNTIEIANLIAEIRIFQSPLSENMVEDMPDLPSPTLIIEEANHNIEELKNELTEVFDNSYKNIVKHHYESMDLLSIKCTDILIDYTYCRTLLASKYYNDNTPTVFSSIDLNDMRRKIAFNIRNSIQFIEAIKEKCILLKNRLTELELGKVFELSNTVKDIFIEIDSNSDSLQNIESLTNETAKSNGINSFLGCLALSITFVSLTNNIQNRIWKILCVAGAIVVFIMGILFYVNENGKKRPKSNRGKS